MIDTLFNHCQSRRHHKERCDDDVVVVVVVVCYRMRPARKIVFRSVVVDVLTHTHTHTNSRAELVSNRLLVWFSLSHSAVFSSLLDAFSFFQRISLCVFSWEMWFGISSSSSGGGGGGGGFRSLLITKRYTIGEGGWCCWQRAFITHSTYTILLAAAVLVLVVFVVSFFFLSRNSQVKSSLDSSLRNSSVIPSSLNGSWLMLN